MIIGELSFDREIEIIINFTAVFIFFFQVFTSNTFKTIALYGYKTLEKANKYIGWLKYYIIIRKYEIYL